MDDERKKPPRGKPGQKPSGGSRDGKKFGAGRDGAGKFGGKKPYAKSAEGDRKPFVRRERPADGEQRAERKPFVKREDGGEGRSYAPREGAARKPYVKREEGGGDKPFRKPFVKREDGGEGRSYAPREGAARKSYVKREEGGGDRPFRKPFVKREDGGEGRSFTPREGAARKPYVKREEGGGDRPFRKPFVKREDSGEGRSYAPREGAPRKPFGDRPPRERSERSEGFRPRTPRDDRTAPGAEAADGSERIAKRLARAGIASRRDAEELIAAGRIRVNGKVLESPAFNVAASDRIELDGELIPDAERTRLFIFHKPAGVVTTNRDPEGRRTVFDVLPQGLPRLVTVGRLDINTEGLLLLTNDGGLSRVMELPATGWLRRYRVRVHGDVDEQALADLRDGVAVDGVFYGAIEAQLDRAQGTNAWLTIGLREGKNREVKNVLGSLGLEVTRLIRLSYGPFQLGELPEGHVMEIKGRTLREQLGDRLIEDSGANFEADIATPFPNRPVRKGYEDKPAERPREQRREQVREGEGGLIKNYRRDKDRKRVDTLDRWSTSRDGDAPRFKKRDDAGAGPRKPFGDKPRGKPRSDERDEPAPQPDKRRVNVWMAPGARPQGKRPSERAADKKAGEKRADGRPPRRSDGMRGDRPQGDRPQGGKPRGDRPSGGSGRPPRGDSPRPGRSGPGGGKPPRGRGKP